ncbi:hypothetical protein D3C78_489800 [compost metagenome]
MHLADVGPGLGTARVVHVGKAQFGQLWIGKALLTEVRAQATQAFGVTTVVDPRRTHVAQAFTHVNHHVGIGVRARGIVDSHRGVDFAAEVSRRHVQGDFAHRHADVRARALDVDFLRTGKGLNRLLIDLGRLTEVDRVFCFYGHHGLSRQHPGSGLSEQNLKGTDAPGLVLCIVVERSIVEQNPGRSTRGLAG